MHYACPMRMIDRLALSANTLLHHRATPREIRTLRQRRINGLVWRVSHITLSNGQELAIRQVWPRSKVRREFIAQRVKTTRRPNTVEVQWSSRIGGFIALEWIKGPALGETIRRSNSADLMDEALNWLADYHRDTRVADRQLDLNNDIEASRKKLREIENRPYLCDCAFKVLDLLEDAQTASPVKSAFGPWHGDFHCFNIINHQDGLQVLDFEAAEFGFQMRDLSKFSSICEVMDRARGSETPSVHAAVTDRLRTYPVADQIAYRRFFALDLVQSTLFCLTKEPKNNKRAAANRVLLTGLCAAPQWLIDLDS